MQAKDRIIVMLTGDDPDTIIESAEVFEENINELVDNGLINSVTAYADEDVISKCTSFIYEYLPIFLTDEDYVSLEKRVSETQTAARMGSGKMQLDLSLICMLVYLAFMQVLTRNIWIKPCI